MSDTYITSVSERYIELYEQITGDTFEKADTTDIGTRINDHVVHFLGSL